MPRPLNALLASAAVPRERVLGVVPGSWMGPDGPQAAAVTIAGLVIPRIAG